MQKKIINLSEEHMYIKLIMKGKKDTQNHTQNTKTHIYLSKNNLINLYITKMKNGRK